MTKIDAGRADDSFSEFEASESGVRYYCREMRALFARAANARVWDEDGHEYIDFLSGCGSLNYGHNHPLMKAQVIDYLANDGLLNGLDLHTSAKREFLRAFREIILAPRDMSYRIQFTGPTGTNAVEAALKLARKVTGRRAVVAFTNAFHGMSLGALSVGARHQHRRSAGVDLDGVVRLPYDGYLDAGTGELDRYEAMVKDPSGGMEPPAAFIVETIQGEGGLNAARAEWLQHLAGVAKRLGALTIVDDVQAGCGRTGDFFSFERMRIKPDLVCLAKSISGIGLPMALLLIRPEHDQWAPGEHNGTFRGNNLAFVAATAAVRLWCDPDFLASASCAAATIRHWLDDMTAELGSDCARAKGRGLLSGIAFSDPTLARHVAREAFRHKLLIETSGPHGEVVKIMPPLTIEPDVLQQGLQRLRSSIESAAAHDRLRPAA
jgi:diaminobutyrate-2-oxoglutarate transaminase